MRLKCRCDGETRRIKSRMRAGHRHWRIPDRGYLIHLALAVSITCTTRADKHMRRAKFKGCSDQPDRVTRSIEMVDRYRHFISDKQLNERMFSGVITCSREGERIRSQPALRDISPFRSWLPAVRLMRKHANGASPLSCSADCQPCVVYVNERLCMSPEHSASWAVNQAVPR